MPVCRQLGSCRTTIQTWRRSSRTTRRAGAYPNGLRPLAMGSERARRPGSRTHHSLACGAALFALANSDFANDALLISTSTTGVKDGRFGALKNGEPYCEARCEGRWRARPDCFGSVDSAARSTMGGPREIDSAAGPQWLLPGRPCHLCLEG
jgi:hypothetical protein